MPAAVADAPTKRKPSQRDFEDFEVGVDGVAGVEAVEE